MKLTRLALTSGLTALLLVTFSGCAKESALVNATKSGSVEITKTLLDRGADPNQSDWLGSAALHVAAEKNSMELIKLLVENGANVSAKNSQGETPLILAIGSSTGDSLETVKYLIKHGADVGASSYLTFEKTALAAAASKGNAKIVNFLLEHGASPDK
ncbi:MAG: ankyrin repeat domain-containing protein [Myxococcales bacterium]|nr:ankyrin repeat domain-containing protein [Myxococcales bacterium]